MVISGCWALARMGISTILLAFPSWPWDCCHNSKHHICIHSKKKKNRIGNLIYSWCLYQQSKAFPEPLTDFATPGHLVLKRELDSHHWLGPAMIDHLEPGTLLPWINSGFYSKKEMENGRVGYSFFLSYWKFSSKITGYPFLSKSKVSKKKLVGNRSTLGEAYCGAGLMVGWLARE